jgi:beta-lactamase superfamily II metal-dependent hydrolase
MTKKVNTGGRKSTTQPAKRTKRVGKSPTKAIVGRPASASHAVGRPTIRVYRQGLGDCILVRLPMENGSDFSIMIDCGVAVATQDAAKTMTRVMDDIVATTGVRNKVDVLAVTHEHWDHVSGFQQAQASFNGLAVGEVWLAWTEDDTDELAKKLKKDHSDAFAALSRSAAVRAMSGDSVGADDLLQVAGLLGAAGEKTKAALDIAKAKAGAGKPRYLLPTDPPIEINGTGARVYALGPPHDETAIRNFNPSKKDPQTYELALDGSGLLGAGVFTALGGGAKDIRPFADSASIPMELASAMPFFQHHYLGTPGDASEWRRIDGDWLGGTDEFALMLQSATNNTSLVLAIELANGDIMLFAGDAQVGNWLSWQTLSWSLPDGRTVTGPDLLARTVFYKVGHHGSHNATLRQRGLEEMKRLRTAVIPVDEVVAKKMRWGAMPLTSLVEALDAQTSKQTFRTDRDTPNGVVGLVSTDLYFEFEI